jgi:LCP family protein required for cell wall assembly
MENPEPIEPQQKPKRRTGWIIFLSISGGLIVACLALYFLWFRPAVNQPLSEPLSQLPLTPAELPTAIKNESTPSTTDPESTPGSEPVTIGELLERKSTAQAVNIDEPVCGEDQELTILMVAIDYQGSDYLYGLADVIRLVHIDFTEPRLDVVALPRALLVQVPPNLVNVDGPILLNQGYLFGTEGMGHFTGTGLGAGSLAETILYNYGISSDYYVVFNMNAFVSLIDRLGGIEVDLPTYVDDRPRAYFPAGKQTLSGEEALTLGRIRRKYSDNVRIDNQNIIIQAVINKMRQPETLLRLPGLAEDMFDAVLTDGSLNQIPDGICLLRNLDREDINFYNPGDDLIYNGREFVPTVDKTMEVFFWDSGLVEWMFNIFWPSN